MKTPKRHINRSYNYNESKDQIVSAQSHDIIFNPLSDDQIKISELPESSGLDGGDLLPIVDISGASLVTKKITLSNFIDNTFNTTILPSGDNIKFSFSNNTLYIYTSPTGSFSDLLVTNKIDIDNIRIDGNTITSTNNNGNLIIQTTGDGALQRTATGDSRGIYSVDLQSSRASGNQVAAANYSTIVGGQNNSIGSTSDHSSILGGNANSIPECPGSVICGGENNRINSYSSSDHFIGGGVYNKIDSNYSWNNVIVGGDANTIGSGMGESSSYSFIGGGYKNTIGGDFNFGSFIGGGYNNKISAGGDNDPVTYISHVICGGEGNLCSGSGGFLGTNDFYSSSVIGGGSKNITSGNYVTIPGGYYAKADRYGELAHAAGRFSSVGDAQHSIFVLRTKTSGNPAGPTELSLDGTSSYLTISNGTILSGTANIVGSKSDGSVVARYCRQFTIKNVGGTTSLVGSHVTIGTDEANGTSISITANNTSDYLSIKVSGVNNETWRWVATVDAVNMAYGS